MIEFETNVSHFKYDVLFRALINKIVSIDKQNCEYFPL